MSSQRIPDVLPCSIPHIECGFSDIFKIGIGPSSSHTVGPMVAAQRFVEILPACEIKRIKVTAFGSLAWTGSGHATDTALVLGLAGHRPDTIDPDRVPGIIEEIYEAKVIFLSSHGRITFDPQRDVVFDKKRRFPRHSNALCFEAFGADGAAVANEMFYSIGGGLVVGDVDEPSGAAKAQVPFPFASAFDLLERCEKNQRSIADVVLSNECAREAESAVLPRIDAVIDAMMTCIDRGLQQSGTLPGRLKVGRRAKALHDRLLDEVGEGRPDSALHTMEFVSTFAMAVNEENASGGRVVTAPTNGAAGVIPAVLRYYRDFHTGASPEGMRIFLLTATAIGSLIKGNASISGAEVGCQGEVGSAASMAAAGLAAALGATPRQVENAAEIAMEHHLGMTCDPNRGLGSDSMY